EPEKAAAILHALALENEADFSVANRLYRERATLNESALAFLSGAFVRMGRDNEAGELLDLLVQKARKDGDTMHWQGSTTVARMSSSEDITAMALWSLAKGSPQAPATSAAAKHLLSKSGVTLGAQSPLQGLWAAALTESFLTQSEAPPSADFAATGLLNGQPL